jgi:hypothetical protein
MHQYSTDSNERARVPLWIAGFSLVASWLLHVILVWLNFTPPFLIEVPSFGGFYYIFHEWFDKKLWRLPIFRTLGLVKVPDLAGTWEGYIVTSFDSHGSQKPATLQIKQTWSELKIILETKDSISNSETASIITKTPDIARVSYEYLNEPKPHAASSMEIHRGLGRHDFQLTDVGEVFDGDYYTGRGRSNFGSLNFKRVSKPS